MSTSFIWLIIIIFLAFLEAITINLVTIWFVISGLVSLITSLFIDDFVIQFAIFVLLGILLLIVTKPSLKKLTAFRKQNTNIDRIINMKGIVTKDILKNKNGEVKVDGKYWTAYANDEIKVDSIVKILEIDGAKLKVEKVED